MKVEFQKTAVACLRPVLREVRTQEQTQEIRLTEGMPDVGRVLASWGQPVLRSKEWHSDEISASAGLMVWVLYAPEDGSQVRCVESWVPFQLKWDLPERTADGNVRLRCLNRFVDARAVSGRKLMVRAGMSALAEAMVPMEVPVCKPGEVPEEVELLHSPIPVRLAREAGEKQFLLDEDLTLPPSVPQPEKLIACTLWPEVTEQRVLADKVVLRGRGNAHVLYLSEEGQIHSWDFELPFSQFAELSGSFSGEAQAWVLPEVTNLEADLDDEGHLRLKCALVGQFLVDDVEMLQLVEDAYSPGRVLEPERELLELPAILETRRETIRSELALPLEANLTAEVTFLPDFPRQQRTETGVEMTLPGMYQVLYYGEDGALQGTTARWEGKLDLRAGEDSRVEAVPLSPSQPQALLGGGMTLRGDLPLELTTWTDSRIPMVTGFQLGEALPPDPARPSLILRRCRGERLWDMARQSGSTIRAIQKANGLEGEPEADQMLLIPVP